MRTFALLLFSICFPTLLVSQSLNLFPRGEIQATTQSIYAINTNPANLGKKPITRVEYQLPVLSGAGFISSTGLSSSKLRSIFFNRNEQIEDSEKNDISSFFVNEQTDLSTNWSFLSIAFNTSKNGRLGINIGTNITGTFKVNEKTADLIFNGSESTYAYEIFEAVSSGDAEKEITKFTNGTTVELNSGTNFDLAYGNKIKEGKNATHYFGVGIRYRLYSIGIDLESEEGNFSGYTSYLDSNDDFDILGFGRPNVFFKNLFGDSGHGVFLNAGYSIETNKGTNFSIAVRNAGYVRIKGNRLEFNPDLVVDALQSIETVDILSELPDYLLSGGLFDATENNTIEEFSIPYVIGSLSKTIFNSRVLLGLEATTDKDFKLVTDVNVIDKEKSNFGLYTGLVGALRGDNVLLWNIPAGFRFTKELKKVNFGISWSTYVLGYFDQKRPFINGQLGIHLAHKNK